MRRRGARLSPQSPLGPCLLQIQDIVRRRQLLTIFREGKDGQQDVDVAILQALLKGEGQASGARGGSGRGGSGPRVCTSRGTEPWSDVLVRGQLWWTALRPTSLSCLVGGGVPASGVGGPGPFLQLLCFTGTRGRPH